MAVSVVLLWGGFGAKLLPAQERAAQPPGNPSGPIPLVLEEFDGTHPNGKWDIHQYSGTFDYQVKPDGLVMADKENRNQHLTRRGFLLDPKGRYAAEASFVIHERTRERPPNSFCLNFHVAGPEDSLESISCWSVNVDVAPGENAGGVMKYMGFVDGRFREIGQRKVAWASTGVEYRMRVEVNTDNRGQFKPKTLTVTVTEGSVERERFEVDYSPFPYQPDLSQPVRIGVNSHGADWTLRNLKVYSDTKPIPAEKEKRS
jgi:hypothetical protein